jgi:hypothetical protein
MSEKPTTPKPGKLKLRKMSVKDLALRTDQAGKVQGGLAKCPPPSAPGCGGKS